MELDKEVLNQIVEQLKPADPYKIVLFGSYAKGTATKDSDIDLLVILDSNEISERKLDRDCEVHKLILNINYQYPIDLLVYSRAEFHKLNEGGNSFYEAISKTWRMLYEKGN